MAGSRVRACRTPQGRHAAPLGHLAGLTTLLALAGLVACATGHTDPGFAVGYPAGVAADPPPPRAGAAARVTAFIDVSVIPMDRERVLAHQTVLVRGDRIVGIGAAGHVRVPNGADTVDGVGKFLLPGLADLHVHMPCGLGADTANQRSTQHQLVWHMAHGVTTIRIAQGDPSCVELRRRVARGELVGPRIYTAGPYINFYAVLDTDPYDTTSHSWADRVRDTPEAAERVVAEQKAAGYDFLKLTYGSLSPATLDAFFAAAQRARIPVMMNRPSNTLTGRAYGFEEILRRHPASVEHVAGVTEGMEKRVSAPQFEPLPTDSADARTLAAAIKRARVWCDPTGWNPGHASMAERNGRWWYFRRLMFVALLQVGARDEGLLHGTDQGSDYADLDAFVAGGVTPYQALETATRNPAIFFGTLDSTGTVTVGKRADLVLLPGNPLMDMRHIRNPVGTMVGGRWFPRADMLARLPAGEEQRRPP